MTETEIEVMKDALNALEELCVEVRLLRNWDNSPYFYVRENLREVIEAQQVPNAK